MLLEGPPRWQSADGLDPVSGYEEILADASMPGTSKWFPGTRIEFAVQT